MVFIDVGIRITLLLLHFFHLKLTQWIHSHKADGMKHNTAFVSRTLTFLKYLQYSAYSVSSCGKLSIVFLRILVGIHKTAKDLFNGYELFN